MFKIGCIGHAGRHGEFLSRVFNRDCFFEGYKFAYVFGEDEFLTQEQKDERFYGIEKYCDTVEELIDLSDAVMILTIPGESHIGYAKKVIDSGKPLFVDKPFTNTLEDAVEITQYAESHNVPLFGGSTLRHLKKLDEIKEILNQEPFPFITISYRADPESPLGLYHYYASHVSEICMSLCGPNYLDVSVVRNGKNVCSTVKFEQTTAVIMTTLDTQLVNINLIGKNTYSFDLNQDRCYIDGAQKFVEMIETGVPPVPYVEFCNSVKLLQEITEKMSPYIA